MAAASSSLSLWFRSVIEAERPRLILWSPAALMVGIGIYFSLSEEPPAFLGLALLAASVIPLLLLWTRASRIFAAAVFLIALGFFAAQFRAHMMATPLLPHELRYAQVEGTIDEIEPVENRIKLVLSHLTIDGLSENETPQRVRISFREREGDWKIGERVRVHAALFPLPQAVMPDGYDFARHFYFRRIGGNGYALGAPEIIQNASESSFHIWLNNLRHSIGEDMRASIPGPEGAVAAGMTVGETGPIPEATKNTLRDSGLAHMLAIAGLHLGIVAGIVFFTVRLSLTLIPAVALRFDVKKIAASCALFSAFFYLLLAGEPIPAQRAFIMVALLFLGYLVGRQTVSLRTLMLACCFILLVFPESLFGASFQLSFAATLAIVALFENFGAVLHRPGGVLARLSSEFLSILAMSLIATLATMPFVLYNFNRFASFGLIANMAVIPLATFVIMPGIVLSLLLMPLGLQWIGYIPLKYGTQMMLAMANQVTSLPFASVHLPAPSDGGVMMCAFGLCWLCLMTRGWRFLGIVLMLLGLSTMLLHEPPDLLVSYDGHQAMLRLESGRYTTLKGSPRGFTIQNWLRAEGEDEAVKLKDSGIDCDREICDITRAGYRILFLKSESNEEVSAKACAQKSDLLIGWEYFPRENCVGAGIIIDRKALETYGTEEIFLRKNGIVIRRTLEHSGQRLWQLPLPAGEEEAD